MYKYPTGNGVDPHTFIAFSSDSLSPVIYVNGERHTADRVDDVWIVKPSRPFEDNDIITVAVEGQETWTFETRDSLAPRFKSASPTAWSVGNTSPVSDVGVVVVDANTPAGAEVLVDGSVQGTTTVTITGNEMAVGVSGLNLEDGRHDIDVTVYDVTGNDMKIRYWFDVGSASGMPMFSDVLPRQLHGLTAPQDISVHIESTSGVSAVNIDAAIDGVPAVVTSIVEGTGLRSSVSVSSTSGVSVIKFSAQDDGGVDGEKYIRASFSSSDSSQAVASSPISASIVDLSESSFCCPHDMKHTGFAADGRWYDEGLVDLTKTASWFNELGQFPNTVVVARGQNSWWLCDVFSPDVEWCRFDASTELDKWNMGGGIEVRSISGHDDQPKFISASTAGVVVVDFVKDSAELLGVRVSSYDISERGQEMNIPKEAGGYGDSARTACLLDAGQTTAVGTDSGVHTRLGFTAMPGGVSVMKSSGNWMAVASQRDLSLWSNGSKINSHQLSGTITDVGIDDRGRGIAVGDDGVAVTLTSVMWAEVGAVTGKSIVSADVGDGIILAYDDGDIMRIPDGGAPTELLASISGINNIQTLGLTVTDVVSFVRTSMRVAT